MYRVVARHQLQVHVVANRFLRVSQEPLIERVVVPEGLDAADDWIAGRVGPRDIVITTDVPLAS
jgi:uncharacterized protein